MQVRLTAPALLLALATPGLAQQAAQLFEAPVITVPNQQQRMNALLDFNDDGWTDAVGTFFKRSDRVAVSGHLNDGTGKLVPLFEFQWAENGSQATPTPIAVADLNGDGLDDFVLGIRNELKVFVSNGATAPTLVHDIPLPLAPDNEVYDLVLGDYDDDGVVDAAARLFNVWFLPNDRITIFEDLLGTPSVMTTLEPPVGAGIQLENVDADGDGVMDLVLLGGEHVDFFTVEAGTLVHEERHTTSLGASTMGAVGDVDGDLDQDVVVFEPGGTYCVLRRTGAQSFAMEPAMTGGPATGLADIDGDGDLDGVCCGGGGGPVTYSNNLPSWFELSINDGTGAFEPAFKLPSMGANAIAGVDDIDHDGDPDLIAGRVIFYNQDGFHAFPLDTLPNWGAYWDLYDADGDGDTDVRSELDVFQVSRGDGTFAEQRFVVPASPEGVSWELRDINGDFDGDGDVDVIASRYENGVFVQERVLSNNGGGGLSDAGPALPPGEHFRPLNGYGFSFLDDLNGDGRIDVVAGMYSPQKRTTIALQQPDGSFVVQGHLEGENANAVDDIDEDGFADVVTNSDDDVIVHFGAATPAGTSTMTFSQPAGSFAFNSYALIADLDDDTDLDVLVARHVPMEPSAKQVRVLENLGGRTFAVRDDLFADYLGFLAPAIAGDLNGDGATDVVLGQPVVGGSTVFGNRVYLGSNTPGLDFTSVGAETYPLYWDLRDHDGDGDLDGFTGTWVLPGNRVRVPESGSRLQRGQGTPGLGGQRPVLGAAGPFVPGTTVEFVVSGAAPNVGGVMYVGPRLRKRSLADYGVAFPLVPAWATLPFFAASSTGEWGSGKATMPVSIPLSMVGRTIHHQALLFDPAGQGGATLSNLLTVRYAD